MLVNELREQDYVSIVVYAGGGRVGAGTNFGGRQRKNHCGDGQSSGRGLDCRWCRNHPGLQDCQENFKKNGNNRVILATDGDFNVGASDNQSMEELIEEKRKDGIFLTVLGYGMGNYKDSKWKSLPIKEMEIMRTSIILPKPEKFW
jgi:Ca-activated chloride channel family protein